MTPDDPRHGTPNGYHNLGCRCDRCKNAQASWHASRARAKGIPTRAEAMAARRVHGTYKRWWNGCRCDECVAGARVVMRDRKRRQRARNAT